MTKYRSMGRVGVLLLTLGVLLFAGVAAAQVYDPNPPAAPVKLIFIHHSCGENWLSDDDGGLGVTLGANNYFVSDTNYGWGPDSIGDRTDITNWPEWFTGPDSGRYLAALYAESGQNSWYTRNLSDPGGENQIIMFKSCYPNSNLEGEPDDPPSREGDWLSVGNAKAIYNELLGYFATRPDKLFIAITAPPVQDPTYSANARAFNNWLVQEWLEDYGGANVAVFDFYNVLTGPDTHHRFQDTYIEHGWGPSDTAYYVPRGDDHPTSAGNRKATEELIPLLNVYYHLWAPPPAEATPGPPPPPTAPPVDTEPPAVPVLIGGMIDDFEGGGGEWEVYHDGGGDTWLTCGRDEADSFSGTAGLHIEYDIAPEGWASCNLVYPGPQDWGGEQGVTVYLRAEQLGQPVIIAAYQGDSDALSQFELWVETNQEAVDGWQRVDIFWDELRQPEWEGDGAARFDPGRAMGLAFIFDADSASGSLWVDDLSFLSAPPPAGAPPPTEPAEAPEPAEEASPAAELTEPEAGAPPELDETDETDDEGGSGICPGSTTIGLLALLGFVWTRQRVPEDRGSTPYG